MEIDTAYPGASVALEATILLHHDLLEADGWIIGYGGEKETFLELLSEMEVVVDLNPGCLPEQYVHLWYQYQEEVENGERELFWWKEYEKVA